jgi:hypothetical protein
MAGMCRTPPVAAAHDPEEEKTIGDRWIAGLETICAGALEAIFQR